jgi:heme o synthase
MTQASVMPNHPAAVPEPKPEPQSWPARLKVYYYLTKPGIIYGNAVAAVAGFLLATHGWPRLGLLAAMLAGLSLVIASACVFNNYLDRRLDALMARTQRRALVRGRVSGRAALAYATILGVLGVGLLAAFTNWLTVIVALVGFVDYVVLYGWGKRHSVHSTLIGSISGAVPPVVGYCAVTGRFDAAALILFLILVCWQMPHFYAIAIYRLDDYAAARLPVLPVSRGIAATKRQIVAYIVAFMIVAASLTVAGRAGYVYLAAVLLMGALWLKKALAGFHAPNDHQWARQLFLFSLLVLMVTCAAIATAPLLP